MGDKEIQAAVTPSKSEEMVVRQTANFRPSIWGDFFIAFSQSPFTSELQSSTSGIIEGLKAEVTEMLESSTNDLSKSLSLIDDIQRLGLSYHFEKNFNELLRCTDNGNYDENHSDDVNIISLHFRLLRQQGHNVSSDALNKLKDTTAGKFKPELCFNVKGLLNLYDASWLGSREENILDEAKDFVGAHIKNIKTKFNCGDTLITDCIERALEMPLNRGMRRLEARHYIASCNRNGEAVSRVLLELAKLDFNLLQSLHQAEIKAISMWWKEVGLVKKLSFARDRVVECYFWTLGVHFEPEYSRGRVLLAKIIALASVMDDMFDAYGTLDELQLFTHFIQRWDFEDVEQLPKYMRIYLKSYMSIIKEIEDDLSKKGRLHYLQYLIESIKAWVEAYLVEAKWASSGYMPTLEEYLHISVTTSVHPMLICVSLIVMRDNEEDSADDEEDVLRLVLNVPKIVEASALIGRLKDDLVSTKFEQERNHVCSSLQCYMNDYGTTEQEARIELTKMIANAWKDMNEEWIKPCTPSERHLKLLAINFARMAEVIYKHEDGYTNPYGEMKENIALLLVHPIQD